MSADTLLTQYAKIQKYNKNFPNLTKPLTPLKKAVALFLLEKHGLRIGDTLKNVPVEQPDQVVATLTVKRKESTAMALANAVIAQKRSHLLRKQTNTNEYVGTSEDNTAITPFVAIYNANTTIDNARKALKTATESIAASASATSASEAKCAQLIARHNRNVAMHVVNAVIYYKPESYIYQDILEGNQSIQILLDIANNKVESTNLDPTNKYNLAYALKAKAQFLGDTGNNGYDEKTEYKENIKLDDLCNIIEARKYMDAMHDVEKRQAEVEVVAPTDSGNHIASFYIAIGNWWRDSTNDDAFTDAKTKLQDLNTTNPISGLNKLEDTTMNGTNVLNPQITAVNRHVDALIQHTYTTFSIIASALDYNSRLLDQLSTELMVKAQPDPEVSVVLGARAQDDGGSGIITPNMLI